MAEGPQLVFRGDEEVHPQGAIPFGDLSRPAKSIMIVPVRSTEGVVAVLTAQSYRSHAYSQTDLQILQSLADHCGGALERIRASAALAELNLQLEQRVRDRTTQLEAMNKELEAFSYSVSHDLRAPLRSIRGFSEVLMESYAQCLDAEGRDYLKRVCASGRHMERLVEDLLKLSRLGRTELQHEIISISQLVQSAAEELARAHPDRRVDWRIAPGLTAFGDSRLLRVMLDNLLQNAWKFSARKEVAVIEFGRLEGAVPTFYVRDNGAGFDMQYAGKLFGVFQRLHPASEFAGTGIGLATVQRIIARHGGRVWAEGRVGEGATFYFTLPSDESN
jgi:light-regulated signal transduction histidine kinase (bacteriophytochrome)